MSKKNKGEIIQENVRKNPYIVATFVLFLLVLVLVINNIVEANAEKTPDSVLCDVIYSTPAWSIQGKIIGYGTVLTEYEWVNKSLIPYEIKFLYNPYCSACQKQIEFFKEQGTWEDYVDKGLAIDCSKI